MALSVSGVNQPSHLMGQRKNNRPVMSCKVTLAIIIHHRVEWVSGEGGGGGREGGGDLKKP